MILHRIFSFFLIFSFIFTEPALAEGFDPLIQHFLETSDFVNSDFSKEEAELLELVPDLEIPDEFLDQDKLESEKKLKQSISLDLDIDSEFLIDENGIMVLQNLFQYKACLKACLVLKH